MKYLSFTWDHRKSIENKRKHHIVFEEAKTAFGDENAIVIADPDHSDFEERFLLIGLSEHLKLLVVVHCYQDNDTAIRIISARKATRKEEKTYSRRWL
jgi:uncharacterized DUF497 family protein